MTSHTSATNNNTAGSTSEVATAVVPDSVVQRKNLHLSHEKEAFSGNTEKQEEIKNLHC